MGHPVFCLGLDQSLVLRNDYRDPSLGVARLRARLRCLRMTIRERRLYRSPDSAMRNDFLGEDFGVYFWGTENCTPGFSVTQGRFGRVGVPRAAKAFCPYRPLIGKGLLPIPRFQVGVQRAEANLGSATLSLAISCRPSILRLL